jgi:hypothetical protein
MDLVSLLVSILVIGLVIWLLLYIIQLLPLPAPFGQVARIIVIVIGLILLIRILLSVSGVHLTL